MGVLTRRAVGLGLAAATLAAGLAGCPAFLSDDFHVVAIDAGGGTDAAPDGARDATTTPGADAEAGVDASVDATVPEDSGPDVTPEAAACCRGVSDPLDETTFDHWVHDGVVTAFPGYVELTPEQNLQGGALLSPDAAPVTDFDVRFEFSITKTIDAGVPADGIAFVALDRVDAQCDGGSQLCLVGTSKGFALLVRTFHSPSEQPVPYVALIDTSRSIESDAGPIIFDGGIAHLDGGIVTYVDSTAGDPPAGSWKTLCLHASGGLASVSLDGTRILTNVPVAGRALAHWGFVAGTGGSRERNAIRDMDIVGSPVCGDAATCADASPCGE